MKHGYIRLSKRGASEANQRIALADAGVEQDRVHVDDQRRTRKDDKLPKLVSREDAIRCVRKGDVLVVASAGRLGVSREDIRQAIGDIAARGGMVQVVGGEPFGGPQMAALLAFETAGHAEVERERTAPARKARGTALKKELSAYQRDILRAMWRDPEKFSTQAVEMKAEELGIKVKRRTLYKLLGERTAGR